MIKIPTLFPAQSHFFKQIINQSIETFHPEAVASSSRAASSRRTKLKYQRADDFGMTRTLAETKSDERWGVVA